jgi:hypothetical protein
MSRPPEPEHRAVAEVRLLVDQLLEARALVAYTLERYAAMFAIAMASDDDRTRAQAAALNGLRRGSGMAASRRHAHPPRSAADRSPVLTAPSPGPLRRPTMLPLDHLHHALESIRQGKINLGLDHLRQFNATRTETTPGDLVEAGQLLTIGVDLVRQEKYELATPPLRTAAETINRWLFRRGYHFANGTPRSILGADGPAG